MLRILVSSVLLLAASVAVCATGQDVIALPYQNVMVENKNGMAVFNGSIAGGEPGKPAVPYYIATFLIPPDVDLQDVAVELKQTAETELAGTFDVAPQPPFTVAGRVIWPKDRTFINGKDIAVYQTNAFYPAKYLGYVSKGMMREYKLVEVTVYPYLYNPLTKKLRMLTKGVLQVNYPKHNQVNIAQASMPALGSVSRETAAMLKSQVVNPQGFKDYETAASAYASSPPPGYVIIMPYNVLVDDTISGSFEDFVYSKINAGYNVDVITEADWLGVGLTDDKAANAIRTWLQAHYLTDNISYVLFIGNPDTAAGKSSVPMKWVKPKIKVSPSDQDFCASDFFFADLSGDWDSNKNGTYGEFIGDVQNVSGGADKYADVSVGRIPYYGVITDLDKILHKIYNYEVNPSGDDISWRKYCLIPIRRLSKTTGRDYMTGEAIRTSILEKNEKWKYWRIYEEKFGLAKPPEEINLNPAKVLKAWMYPKRVGITIWFGHGCSGGANDIFYNTDAVKLDDAHPAHTYQGSCANAAPEMVDNTSYSLLLNGAVTAVGATKDCYVFGAEFPELNLMSVEGIGYSYMENLVTFKMSAGKALNKTKYSKDIALSHFWYGCCVFNLYGDPDCSLGFKSATTAPTNLNATAVSSNQIQLTWIDNANGQSETQVEMKAPGYSKFYLFKSTARGVASTAIDGLSPNSTYQFRVCLAGQYTYSNTASATTKKTNPLPIAAPTNLTATAVSCSQINLAWKDNSSIETGYGIVRSSTDHIMKFITVGANVTSFKDTGLLANTSYWYYVYAYNADSQSADSNSATATTHANAYPPWQLGATYKVGDIVNYNCKNYMCLQAHTAYAANWNPEQAPALWRFIN